MAYPFRSSFRCDTHKAKAVHSPLLKIAWQHSCCTFLHETLFILFGRWIPCWLTSSQIGNPFLSNDVSHLDTLVLFLLLLPDKHTHRFLGFVRMICKFWRQETILTHLIKGFGRFILLQQMTGLSRFAKWLSVIQVRYFLFVILVVAWHSISIYSLLVLSFVYSCHWVSNWLLIDCLISSRLNDTHRSLRVSSTQCKW